MGSSTLLDTNIAIYLTKGGLPDGVKQQLASLTYDGFKLSVITKIELLGYAFPTLEEKVVTTAFVQASVLYDVTDAIVEKTIAVRRQHRIKLPDAIIAATALVHGLTLVTRNVSDFTPIDKLLIVNPFQT